MMPVLGHGAGGGADELLFLVAAAGAVAAIARLSNRDAGRKRWLGVPLLAAALGVGAVPVVFRLAPSQATVRIASTAHLTILSPRAGAVVSAHEMEVVVRLEGARVTSRTTTRLKPGEGHVHLSIDGTLVSTTGGVRARIPLEGVPPGPHVLQAEFAAADHGPFRPRVLAVVGFTVAR
jgi:hypothetical protein